ncbi:MAG: FAD-dependent oxidoreductase [Phycisphaerae bacterium]|nr:FAD-dependent oxidoreductase [Phycisphaerae bacterium]
MSNETAAAWRCSICGYIHRGDAPPDTCPVCGASRQDFEAYLETPKSTPDTGPTQWRCVNCGYVHPGDTPPAECPVCAAPADRFQSVAEAARALSAPGKLQHVVIIGAGIAGLSAAESLRAASPDVEITLLSKEPTLPYYRLNLTRFVAGEVGENALPIQPENWYEANRIRLARGGEVTGIDLDAHTLMLADGQALGFQKLILTAGAHPAVPPFPGGTKEGVGRFRTVHDAERILAAAARGAKCVIVGGGILGLETAGGLARRGADVTLLEGHGWLLPRQLNQAASPILEQFVAELGVTLVKEARVEEILGDERVQGIRLRDGRSLPAELVVITTGVRPNSYLARIAGLDVNTGVVVDNHLRTSHPDVLAAGDVAEHRGTLYGLWGPSQFQGSIAGMNAAGLSSEFGGIPRSNTLKVLGLDLFSIGEFDPGDASYEVVDGSSDQTYFRFVFRDHLMVGAILLGDTALTSPVKRAIEQRTDMSGLLRKTPSAADVTTHLAERT